MLRLLNFDDTQEKAPLKYLDHQAMNNDRESEINDIRLDSEERSFNHFV